MTTKNSIKAQLTLAINLATQAKAILDEVCDVLAPTAEDDIFDIVNTIQDCERTDIEDIMSDIENAGYFEELKIEEGNTCTAPIVKVDNYFSVSIEKTVPGGSLKAYATECDYETPQLGVLFETSDKMQFDICMVEEKRGELALKPDNTDIDVYTYANVWSEDYTDKYQIKTTDMVEIDIRDAISNISLKDYNLDNVKISDEDIRDIVNNVIAGLNMSNCIDAQLKDIR